MDLRLPLRFGIDDVCCGILPIDFLGLKELGNIVVF
jgi:hypothetical protein